MVGGSIPPSRTMSKLEWFLCIVVAIAGIVFLSPSFSSDATYEHGFSPAPISATSSAATTTLPLATTTVSLATSTHESSTSTVKKTSSVAKKTPSPEPVARDPNAVDRIQNPYDTPPESFDVINEKAREALVNILCVSRSGTMQPISGSGVVIDPRGVVLTNAHVAQYVLLAQSPNIDLSCTMRAGSPAVSKWSVVPLYIPAVWVHEHAHEIIEQHVVGTGEHDYALLLIAGNGKSFPFIPYDTREAIAFQDDPVLVASYPVEFVGSTVQNSLYAVSSITSIKKLMTFVQQTIDVLSLGGLIGAQSGSSGGAVVNAWGRLVGIVVTTSAGATTADRDLHALSMSYISRDLAAQSKLGLEALLSTDVTAAAESFNIILAPQLLEEYLRVLKR